MHDNTRLGQPTSPGQMIAAGRFHKDRSAGRQQGEKTIFALARGWQFEFVQDLSLTIMHGGTGGG